jgi:hypothetical protein
VILCFVERSGALRKGEEEYRYLRQHISSIDSTYPWKTARSKLASLCTTAILLMRAALVFPNFGNAHWFCSGLMVAFYPIRAEGAFVWRRRKACRASSLTMLRKFVR